MHHPDASEERCPAGEWRGNWHAENANNEDTGVLNEQRTSWQ